MIAVVVPTYNERLNIELLYNRLLKVLPKDFLLLVVDDSSSDGTGDFTSIYEAYNSSSDGDTVRIYDGTYSFGGLWLQKGLNYFGNGTLNTIITSEVQTLFFISQSGENRIENMTLRTPDWGVRIAGCSRAIIKNCVFNTGNGLRDLGNEYLYIENCTFNNDDDD